MKDIFYYHISLTNLAHVIVSGAIKPSAYIRDRNDDLQDSFPKSILFSKKKWGKDFNCSIAVLLSVEEQRQLKPISEDYLLLNVFLPISRIFKVYFSEKDRVEDTRWNIENGAGYLPKDWISVEEKVQEEIAGNLPSKNNQSAMEFPDLQKLISAFDRLAGGLAFMRTGIYDINDPNLNYPINYISTISFFNKEIEKELEKENLTFDRSLHKIFSGEAEIFKYLHKPITKEIVQKEAISRGVKVQEKFNLLDLDNLREDHFLLNLGVLYNYGEGKPKKTIDLLASFFNNLDWKSKEEASLIFGLHNGYQSLRNEYKIGEVKWEVKFKMESKIDFYVLEPLYEYVKNKSNKPGELKFLEPILPGANKRKIPINYQAYNILDTTIITQENNYQGKLLKLIKKVSQEVMSWFPKELFTPQEQEIEKRIEASVSSEFSETIKQAQKDLIRNIKINDEFEAIEKDKLKKGSEDHKDPTEYDVDLPYPTYSWTPEKAASRDTQEPEDKEQISEVPQNTVQGKVEQQTQEELEPGKSSDENLKQNQEESEKEIIASEKSDEKRDIKGNAKYPKNDEQENDVNKEDLSNNLEDAKDTDSSKEGNLGGLFPQESEPSKDLSIIELNQLTVKELKAYAKETGMRGYSKSTKKDLIHQILKHTK